MKGSRCLEIIQEAELFLEMGRNEESKDRGDAKLTAAVICSV